MAGPLLLILGIHCSIRDGYLAALDEAASLGCGSMQIFSYRRHREPAAEELGAFAAAREASSVRRLLVHVRYVPFLASADPARRRHSVELLARELRLAAGLGADGLVVHAGAHAADDDVHRGLARFAAGVAEAWRASGCTAGPEVLLENVPGGGRRMGGPLEELAEAAEPLGAGGIPVGFCLDTAHAWAQGYDIASAEGMWKFVGRAHRVLGSDRIKAFHLNDTRSLLGSHREHHWHWGRGHLGTDGLRSLLERPEFKEAAGILETPKDGDRENLELARRLV